MLNFDNGTRSQEIMILPGTGRRVEAGHVLAVVSDTGFACSTGSRGSEEFGTKTLMRVVQEFVLVVAVGSC